MEPQFFAVLVIFSLLEVALSAPYCVIGHPDHKDDKNGYLFGIPAVGYCPKTGQPGKAKFIIPVDQVDAVPVAAEDKNIYSLGLYPKDKFKATLVPLKDYLKKYNIPSYFKFMFVDTDGAIC